MVTDEIEPAVLAELAEHVVEERQAGVDRRLTLPSRSSCTSTRVSLVSRYRLAVRDSRQCLLQGGEERRVLRRRADRDAQTALEAGPTAAIADEHVAVDERLPHLGAVVGARAGTG